MTQEERLIDMISRNASVSDMAKELGRSETTVRRYLRNMGISRSPDRADISVDRVVDLYESGMSASDISKELQCSYETVTKRLSEAGIKPDQGENIHAHFVQAHDALWPDIKAKLDARVSPTRLAKEYHITYLSLLDTMRRHGYPWDYTGLDDRLEKRKPPRKPRKGGMGLDRFIERARATHGDRYDYSQVQYVNTKTKVTIVCPEHGPFEQTPEKHMGGSGCPHSDCVAARRVATNRARYGTDHPLQSDMVKQRSVSTSMERFGAKNVMQSEYGKQRLADSCVQKYGTASVLSNSDVRSKIEKTLEDKYGGGSPFCSEEVRNRAHESVVDKYGVENVMSSPVVKQKHGNTCLARYGEREPLAADSVREKKLTTMERKYGGHSPLCDSEILNKSKSTCFEKYGVGNPMQNADIVSRCVATKIKNGTINTSAPEETLHGFLCEVFGESDVRRQHVSDIYPFACDFYIASRDMYIELNASWTHGGHWFNPNIQSDVDVVQSWAKKGTDYYKNAIHVWTGADVKKRRVASEARLNYVVFWDNDLRDAIVWLAMGCPDGQDWETEYSWLPERDIVGTDLPFDKMKGSQALTQTMKHYQFQVFYAREIAMWQENPMYRGLPLRMFLYHNRLKYVGKTPNELTDLQLARAFTTAGVLKGYTAFTADLMLAVLEKYDIKSVYDPCAGWGERMLCCVDKDIEYHGVDINTALQPGYELMTKELDVSKQTITFGDSSVIVPERAVDAVITCPPYGSIEMYTDAGAENLSNAEFLQWWYRVVMNCMNAKPKYFCFQINQRYRDFMLKVLLDMGWNFVDELLYTSERSSHFTRGINGESIKHERESMLVLTK